MTPQNRKTVIDGESQGRNRRQRTPRGSQATIGVPRKADVAVALIESAERGRLRHLLPIRRERMSASPFAFYRGAAAVMAHDLSDTPNSGIEVQACGDAHLANFGAFATPERQLVFGLNDFDETLPAPWEWDVKRLAASMHVAGRDIGFSEADNQEIVRHNLFAYRQVMLRCALGTHLSLWYEQLNAEELVAMAQKNMRKRVKKAFDKARRRNAEHEFSKLVENVDGKYRFREEPPLLVRLGDEAFALLHGVLAAYRASLQPHHRALLDCFELVDVAQKVVGVGSVGTRCFVALMFGDHENDVLLLQIKEAATSALEPYWRPSIYKNHAQRVVEGQRIIQSVSDVFLGHTRSQGHDYYVRQLKDMKGSADVGNMDVESLAGYARLCGAMLALSHSRLGHAALIAGYLGKSARFDDAICDFSKAYADRNEADFNAYVHHLKNN